MKELLTFLENSPAKKTILQVLTLFKFHSFPLTLHPAFHYRWQKTLIAVFGRRAETIYVKWKWQSWSRKQIKSCSELAMTLTRVISVSSCFSLLLSESSLPMSHTSAIKSCHLRLSLQFQPHLGTYQE